MKKGFSFAILSATIVIMLILLTSITIAGNKTVEDSKKLSFATEIYSLQQSIDSYSEKNGGMYPVKDNIVLQIKDLNETSRHQFIQNDEEITNDKIVLSEIDYDKISMVSLKYGNYEEGETDIYAVSPTTGKVYYAKGMKIGNKTYFTLTDELRKAISSNEIKAEKARENENDLVIFSPSTINWTRQNVSVEIKVPDSCEKQYIFINGENTYDYVESKITGYTVYKVEFSGNYTIRVRYYKKDDPDTMITATYNVNNVDSAAPILEIDGNIVSMLSLDDDTNLLGYLRIIENKDTLSGIKKMKYESNSVYSGVLTNAQKQNVKSHFENSGKDVLSEVIPVEKGSRSVTVYIEDKAGNWALQTIKISQD